MARFKRRLRALERTLEQRFGLTPGLLPPILITQFVSALRDSDGKVLGPNLDFTRGEIDGRTFERGETETLESFESRVLSHKAPGIAVVAASFWCEDDAPNHSADGPTA